MTKRTKKKPGGKPMLPRERSDFSAIVDRPPLKLPNGARIVFWTIVNLEVWDIAKPMARQVLAPPTGVTQLPDVPNWSWHEYGNARRGLAALRALQTPWSAPDAVAQRAGVPRLRARSYFPAQN